MKKIGIIALIGATIITPSFATFSDVPQSHWAYSAISKMEDSKILSGYEDGTFKPSKYITLAEFSSIFSKIFEIPKDNTSNYFTNISGNHWAKGSVEAIRTYINPLYDSVGEALGVTEHSYLKGLPGDIEMTREAFIYAICKMYGYDEKLYSEGEEKLLFEDYSDILYPKEIVIAYKNKIISGEVIDGKTYIRPTRCISRAEASAIFQKLLKYEETRVTNKSEEPQLNARFGEIIKELRTSGVVACKDFIYDTKDILKSEKFLLTDSEIDKLNKLTETVLHDFEYEVVDRGFYHFNKGYVKAKLNCYDVFNRIEELNVENTEEIVDSILNGIAKREIKIVEREEIFGFIKHNGEWKLILN